MAQIKEITASVGVTKQLNSQYENIKLSMTVTKTVGDHEDIIQVYEEAFNEVEEQLMKKLGELRNNRNVTNPI